MWAKLVNGNIAELYEQAQPDIPGLVEVPDDSEIYVDPNVWTITAAQFWALLTTLEQQAISTSTDGGVAQLRIEFAINSQSLSNTNAQFVAGINYLVTIGILTQARATQLL